MQGRLHRAAAAHALQHLRGLGQQHIELHPQRLLHLGLGQHRIGLEKEKKGEGKSGGVGEMVDWVGVRGGLGEWE